MARLDGQQAFRGFFEGFVPADRLPAARRAPDGLAEPVRVLVDVLDRHGLRAEVAPAERVGLVAANREDRRAPHPDGDPAQGLAQVAGSIMGALDVRHAVPPRAVYVLYR